MVACIKVSRYTLILQSLFGLFSRLKYCFIVDRYPYTIILFSICIVLTLFTLILTYWLLLARTGSYIPVYKHQEIGFRLLQVQNLLSLITLGIQYTEATEKWQPFHFFECILIKNVFLFRFKCFLMIASYNN